MCYPRLLPLSLSPPTPRLPQMPRPNAGLQNIRRERLVMTRIPVAMNRRRAYTADIDENEISRVESNHFTVPEGRAQNVLKKRGSSAGAQCSTAHTCGTADRRQQVNDHEVQLEGLYHAKHTQRDSNSANLGKAHRCLSFSVCSFPNVSRL